MVFTPNAEHIKAAPRLCICNECKLDHGSCSLFETCELQVCFLKEPMLRSQNFEHNAASSQKATSDFFLAGSVCAVAADAKSYDTVWFIEIIDEGFAHNDNIVDDYGHQIALGQNYLIGHYFERDFSSSKHEQLYTCMKKKIFFYKESVVYPFVNFQSNKTTT